MLQLIAQRSFVLSILFGMSFGILILYATDTYALLIVLLLLTSTVFAAKRDDLKELGRSKTLIILIILVAALTISLSVSAYPQLGANMFEVLTVLDFAILLVYIAISRMRRFPIPSSTEN